MYFSKHLNKNSICLFVCLLLILCFAGCSQIKASNIPLYELYPTQNIYNFLKLNTKTGVISKVQFAINNDNARFERPINSDPLVNEALSEEGRFKLYPTTNIYNFLLLDQITGKVWQVQWSNEAENCGIVGEIKP